MVTGPTGESRAVEISRLVAEKAALGGLSVFAIKAVQHFLVPQSAGARREFVHSAARTLATNAAAPENRRGVQVSGIIENQRSPGLIAVGSTGKRVNGGFGPIAARGWCQLEHAAVGDINVECSSVEVAGTIHYNAAW